MPFVARSHVFASAAAVLATVIAVYVHGRYFALALASAGLSVALPFSTRALLASGWGLALAAIFYSYWSYSILIGTPSTVQTISHSVAGVLGVALLLAWGVLAYSTPLQWLIP